MSDKTCKTCRHWASKGVFGECHLVEFFMDPRRADAPFITPNAHPDGAITFWTPPNYGCNRWDGTPEPIDREAVEDAVIWMQATRQGPADNQRAAAIRVLFQWLADHPEGS